MRVTNSLKISGEKADATAIVITNAKTQEIHAIFKSNTIQYKETYRFLYTLIMKHIPNSVIIVENNIDTLIEYIKDSPLKHLLYYEFRQNPTLEKRKDGFVKPQDRNNIIYGITTTNQNRPKYFDILFEYVHSMRERINCQELIEEIECLEYKNATRIEAVSNKHDDTIMSYLLGQYVMHYGNNKARFGLIFSEGIDISDRNFANNDALKDAFNMEKRKGNLYDNPFFNALFVKPETLDEIERKLARSLSIPHLDPYEENEFGANCAVFAGERDVVGMNVISEDAFSVLNSYGNIDDDDDDEFNWGSRLKMNKFVDDDVSEWF